jgi:hypothetical protein
MQATRGMLGPRIMTVSVLWLYWSARRRMHCTLNAFLHARGLKVTAKRAHGPTYVEHR